MNVSQKGIAFLKNAEGLRLKPYLDSAGIPTIGIGSITYKDGRRVSMNDPAITVAQAEELLMWEARKKEKALEGLILNQNQYDACLSLLYNIGIGGFNSSTVKRKIQSNPCDPSIRDAFMMWNKITKNGKKVEDKGLAARRKKEADLYFSV